VNEALAQMAFSPSSRSEPATRAIKRAVNQASAFHGLNTSALLVEAAWTGKHLSAPRIRHHSKGRAGRAAKRTSQLSVRLREMTPDEASKKNKFTRVFERLAETRAALDPRAY
jgi:ribosomal protein L22